MKNLTQSNQHDLHRGRRSSPRHPALCFFRGLSIRIAIRLASFPVPGCKKSTACLLPTFLAADVDDFRPVLAIACDEWPVSISALCPYAMQLVDARATRRWGEDLHLSGCLLLHACPTSVSMGGLVGWSVKACAVGGYTRTRMYLPLILDTRSQLPCVFLLRFWTGSWIEANKIYSDYENLHISRTKALFFLRFWKTKPSGFCFSQIKDCLFVFDLYLSWFELIWFDLNIYQVRSIIYNIYLYIICMHLFGQVDGILDAIGEGKGGTQSRYRQARRRRRSHEGDIIAVWIYWLITVGIFRYLVKQFYRLDVLFHNRSNIPVLVWYYCCFYSTNS